MDRVREKFRLKLADGKRGEIGRATEVALKVLDNPAIVGDLIDCLADSDKAVVSHGAHAIMQIGGSRPDLFDDHIDRLTDILERCVVWEIGEQLPKILVETQLSRDRAIRLEQILIARIDGKSNIAAASALTALNRLAKRGLIGGDKVRDLIIDAAKSSRKALAARARQLL